MNEDILVECIDDLEEEKENLQKKYDSLQQRIDKAIEYIELWHYRNDFRVNSFTKCVKEELLDILQGSDKK